MSNNLAVTIIKPKHGDWDWVAARRRGSSEPKPKNPWRELWVNLLGDVGILADAKPDTLHIIGLTGAQCDEYTSKVLELLHEESKQMIPSTTHAVVLNCPTCKQNLMFNLTESMLMPPRATVPLQLENGHELNLDTTHYAESNRDVSRLILVVITHCPGGNK